MYHVLPLTDLDPTYLCSEPFSAAPLAGVLQVESVVPGAGLITTHSGRHKLFTAHNILRLLLKGALIGADFPTILLSLSLYS